MNDKAKALLAMFEEVEADRTADPAGHEERRKKGRQEALDLAIERLNQIGELLKAIDEKPEEFTELGELGSLEEIKAKLIKEQTFYSDYYKVMSVELEPLDLESLEAEAQQVRLMGGEYLTGAEYAEYISAALDGDKSARTSLIKLGFSISDINEAVEDAKQQRAANKEAINTISDGNGAAAEALLLTATLADFEAAGASLNERQRNAILKGDTDAVKGIIYDLLFTTLLKLWRVVSDKEETQTAGNLQLVPYATTKPEKTAISISKVAQQLLGIEKTGARGTIFSVDDKGTDVRAIMKYDDENITVIGRPLTEFDKTVHDGAAALYAAGNTYFSIQDLYRACNGLDIARIDAETLAPYLESIETSRTRILKIDATEQINSWFKGKVKKVIYDNYFLPLKGIEITMTNGETVKGYAFLEAPPLYEYSSNIRQIVNAPTRLLRAGKQIRNTPEVAVITNYLIRRIDIIKNKKNKMQPEIAYSAIFEAAGINTDKLDRTQLKRKRDIVKAKLDFFIAQGFISGYEEYKKGKAAAGVVIHY